MTRRFWAFARLTAAAAIVGVVLVCLGGWGPREGVAAWVFSLGGLGAAQGVATGTTCGVLATAASLPGAVFLVAGWTTRRTHHTAMSAHSVVTRRGQWPTTIQAVEGDLDG